LSAATQLAVERENRMIFCCLCFAPKKFMLHAGIFLL